MKKKTWGKTEHGGKHLGSLKFRETGKMRERKTRKSQKGAVRTGGRPPRPGKSRELQAVSSIAYKLLLEAPGTPIRSVHLRDRRLISVDRVEGRH